MWFNWNYFLRWALLLERLTFPFSSAVCYLNTVYTNGWLCLTWLSVLTKLTLNERSGGLCQITLQFWMYVVYVIASKIIKI